MKTKVEFICLQCKKSSYYYKGNSKKYCSKQCWYESKVGKRGDCTPSSTYLNNDFFYFLKPEYAYIAGFLWADGTCRGTGISTTFAIKDAEEIDWIFNLAGNWGKYKRFTSCGTIMKEYKIYSKKSLELLIQLDYNNKSLKSADKVLNKIPLINQPYFLRGFIDGDGCWYIGSGKSKYVRMLELTADINYDWQWIFSILHKIDIKRYNHKLNNSKNGNCSRIIIYGIDQFLKLGDYLYSENIHMGLSRKYKKYQQIISSYKNKTKYQ